MSETTEQWATRQPAVRSERGMVAAQHWRAAQVGASVLGRGGNAVDAAVACALTLGAVEPWSCGLGGSGYAVVYRSDGRAEYLDFQGVLPHAIDVDDYRPAAPHPHAPDEADLFGHRAITVPGMVAGLAELARRHGTLGFDSLVAPAIDVADEGLAVDWMTTLRIGIAARHLGHDPTAAATYLPGGAPPPPGSRLALDALAATFRMLADDGAETFYRGDIAVRIIDDLHAAGSVMTGDDLAEYRVIHGAPLVGAHRGYQLLTPGPTSGGPRLNDALRHVAATLAPDTELGQRAFTVYADALNRAFSSHAARTGGVVHGDECTSHLSTVDADGNMVAMTLDLHGPFGAGVVLPATGITMNNAVSSFDLRPGRVTSIRGGKRVNVSNMCPTIAVRQGHARFAIGASGADHIVPCTFQLATFVIDHGMGLHAAVHQPRIDAANRGSVRVDRRLAGPVHDALASLHRVEAAQQLVYPKLFGCPVGVARDPASGTCDGAVDPSLPSAAARAPPATPA